MIPITIIIVYFILVSTFYTYEYILTDFCILILRKNTHFIIYFLIMSIWNSMMCNKIVKDQNFDL